MISSVSVIDQMVERFFFQAYTDAEGDCYPNLPCKKGIGFSKEHAQMIGDRVYTISETLGVPPVASDVKGWEKNFSLQMAETHCDVMKGTATNRGDCQTTLDRVCEWWALSLVSTPYVLDDGTLIDYEDLTVQRSGDFLTTSSNSSGRGACAEAVGSVYNTAGDDCLEWTTKTLDELKEAYAELDVPVRDVETHRKDSFLFCSHRFERQADGSWDCWLETWERMLYESSFSKLSDLSTHANYMSEIEQMPDQNQDKARIVGYLKRRQQLLGAVDEHEYE